MTMPNPEKPISLEAITLRELIREKLLEAGYTYLGKIGLRKFIDAELAAYTHGGARAKTKIIMIRDAKQPENPEGIMRKSIYTQKKIQIDNKTVHILYEEAPTKPAKGADRLGGNIDLLGVDKNGRIFLLELKHSCDKHTSILETLFQVLLYRAYWSNRNFTELLTPILKRQLEQCNKDDVARCEAIKNSLSPGRRSFAAIAVCHAEMGQLNKERSLYQRLLNRSANRLGDNDVVGLVSASKNPQNMWSGTWKAGCPKSWENSCRFKPHRNNSN